MKAPMTFTLFTTLFMTFSISAFGQRGGRDGGGGDAVLCYKTVEAKQAVQQEILRMTSKGSGDPSFQNEADLRFSQLSSPPQMLEVYETAGKGLFAPSRTNSTGFTSEQQVHEQIQRTDPMFFQYLKPFITKEVQWQQSRYGVLEIDDSVSSQRIAKNCLLVQAAFYDDASNTVHYDTRIVQEMDTKNKLALKLHEDIYRMNRFYNQKSILFLGGSEFRLETRFKRAAPSFLQVIAVLKKRMEDRQLSSASVRPLVSYLISNSQYDKATFVSTAQIALIDLRYSERESNFFSEGRPSLIFNNYSGIKYAIGMSRETSESYWQLTLP